jgi:hypothetical protein
VATYVLPPLPRLRGNPSFRADFAYLDPPHSGAVKFAAFAQARGVAESALVKAQRNGVLGPPAVFPGAWLVPHLADTQIVERSKHEGKLFRACRDALIQREVGVEPVANGSIPATDEVVEAARYLRGRGMIVGRDVDGWMVGCTRLRPDALLARARRLGMGATA